MKKKIPYEKLHILPSFVADRVSTSPYDGREISDHHRDSQVVAKVEAIRKTMTEKEHERFAVECDERCRHAYNHDVPWMMRIVRSNTNGGRNQLYVLTMHWLASYCNKLPARRKEIDRDRRVDAYPDLVDALKNYLGHGEFKRPDDWDLADLAARSALMKAGELPMLKDGEV